MLKRRPITGKNIKPEILLGIAGVLLIIAAFGPWATNLLSVSGWEIQTKTKILSSLRANALM